MERRNLLRFVSLFASHCIFIGRRKTAGKFKYENVAQQATKNKSRNLTVLLKTSSILWFDQFVRFQSSIRFHPFDRSIKHTKGTKITNPWKTHTPCRPSPVKDTATSTTTCSSLLTRIPGTLATIGRRVLRALWNN